MACQSFVGVSSCSSSRKRAKIKFSKFAKLNCKNENMYLKPGTVHKNKKLYFYERKNNFIRGTNLISNVTLVTFFVGAGEDKN